MLPLWGVLPCWIQVCATRYRNGKIRKIEKGNSTLAPIHKVSRSNKFDSKQAEANHRDDKYGRHVLLLTQPSCHRWQRRFCLQLHVALA